MTTAMASSRPFVPGTTGWTADDLTDPEIERHWVEGRYEIVEGVLAQMPPAYFTGGESLFKLMICIREHLLKGGRRWRCSTEVDMILRPRRVAVADAVFMTPEDDRRQASAARSIRKAPHGQARIVVPPTLVIESVSAGHEDHDRVTKREWYAEAGIPNYWLLDAEERSLECLVLEGAAYRTDVLGRNNDGIRPLLFPGLVILLADIWPRPIE